MSVYGEARAWLRAVALRRRKREIGFRLALGAKPQQVVSMFFTGGLRLSVMGLAIGLPISAAALQVLISRFGANSANEVTVTVAVAAIVLCVAAIATWVPALRAAQVDPKVALRFE
ncbi:MAG: FtsX-like permease family protein [Gemmatimonadaceae bacterium]